MAARDTQTDEELLNQLRDGDRLAYTEIYHRYNSILYIHVYNKLRNREESRDIVHELFSRLWQKHGELPQTSSLSAYLYSAVRYKIFDFLSHKEVEHKYINSIREFAEAGEGVTDYVVREKEFMAIIDREIAALPPKMRAVFEMSRKQNLSHKEIAATLGLSEQTVKKQVSNALKVLRGKLGTAIFTAFIL